MNKEPALYNLENLTAFYDSDKNLTNQIIKLFIENIPQYSSELTEASKINNWQSVAFTAHKLKSNIRLFQVDDMFHILYRNIGSEIDGFCSPALDKIVHKQQAKLMMFSLGQKQ